MSDNMSALLFYLAIYTFYLHQLLALSMMKLVY